MAASTFKPTNGMTALAQITTTGAGGTPNSAIVVPGINWTLTVDGKVVDVSNFRDGRFRWDTLHDSTVNLTLVWDANETPTKAGDANIRAGSTGSIQLNTDAVPNFFVVPFIVSEIGPKNEGVENVVMMDVTLQQSGQCGTAFAYPAT